MPHMEEVSFQNEECGTCNLSFSFPDKPDSDTTKDIPICTRSTSPTAAGVTEAPGPLPTEILQSPVILNNNASTATKISCGSPDCHPPKEDMSPTHVIDADRLPKENAGLLGDVTSGPSEEQSNTDLDPVTKEDTNPSPLNEQDVETSSSNNLAESAPCVSSPSSNEMTSAEMDNTLPKPNEQTLSHSPSLSPPLAKETGTPPPTPEHGPLKATLVHIDTSPTDTPPDSPEGTGQTLNAETDQPSTSLDHIHPTEDVESPSPDRRPSTNSGNTFNSRGEEDEDEDGFLGDDDVDKNSEGKKLLEVWSYCRLFIFRVRSHSLILLQMLRVTEQSSEDGAGEINMDG